VSSGDGSVGSSSHHRVWVIGGGSVGGPRSFRGGGALVVGALCHRTMVVSAVADTTEFGLLEAVVSVDLEASRGTDGGGAATGTSGRLDRAEVEEEEGHGGGRAPRWR
jgi:hypothetical protein